MVLGVLGVKEKVYRCCRPEVSKLQLPPLCEGSDRSERGEVLPSTSEHCHHFVILQYYETSAAVSQAAQRRRRPVAGQHQVAKVRTYI